MSIINISDITVLNNPARFTDPYVFKITFECMAPLEDGAARGPSLSPAVESLQLTRPSTSTSFSLSTDPDLEWKLTYVGSAESESFDQELDTCMVGPVPVGVNSFEFEAAAPSPDRIPPSDLIGVTVILLTCAYNDQEFVRIGYYVNTEYGDAALKAQHEASLEEDAAARGLSAPDPSKHIDQLERSVLAEKPRVTKFNIKWCVPFLPFWALHIRWPGPGLLGFAVAHALGIHRDASTLGPTASDPLLQAQPLGDAAGTAPPPFNPYTAAQTA
ncbi:SPOSA6832_03533, partial [Sporobolomyces salmonicolor]